MQTLGQGILGAEKSVAALQLKQEQSAADEKAKVRRAALTQQYGQGKEPVDQMASIETTRLKEWADAQTRSGNAASAAFLAQQERVNSAASTLSAKQKQMADQQLETQRQVTQQMASLDAGQQQAYVTGEQNKLKTLQNSQKLQLEAVKGNAAATLDVYVSTGQAVEAQAISTAEAVRQQAINTAAAQQKTQLLGIPKNASAAQRTALTAGYAAQFEAARQAAESDYTLAVSEAQQRTQSDLQGIQQTQLEDSRRFADELSKLQIGTAQTTNQRLKDLDDAQIKALGENLIAKLALTRQLSQEEFNRQAQLLQATKKVAKDAANANLDHAPPEVVKARLGQADADYQGGYVKAQQQRADAVTQAQKAVSDAAIKEKEGIGNLQKSYRELTDAVQKKIDAGTFDALAQKDALQSFNELTRQSDKLKLTQNELVTSSRTSTYALIDTGRATQQLNQDSKDYSQSLHDLSEGSRTTVTSLTNMLSGLIAEGLDPNQTGYVKLLDELISKGGSAGDAARYLKENLLDMQVAMGSQTPEAIQRRGELAIKKAQDANENPVGDAVGGRDIEARAEDLTGKIIDQIFYVATKDSEKVAENQWGEIVQNARKVMDSPEWADMGEAGRAEFNDNLAGILAKAISNETDPSKLQGLLDFANKQIKDGTFEGVSDGLKEGIQSAIADAPAYLKLRAEIIPNDPEHNLIGGQRDAFQRANPTLPRPPGSRFNELSGIIDQNAEGLRIDPKQSAAMIANLQQARGEGALTEAQLVSLSKRVTDLGSDFTFLSDGGLSKTIAGLEALIYAGDSSTETQTRLNDAYAEFQKRTDQIGLDSIGTRFQQASTAAEKLRAGLADGSVNAEDFEKGMTHLLPRLENLAAIDPTSGSKDLLDQTRQDIAIAQALISSGIAEEQKKLEEQRAGNLIGDKAYFADRLALQKKANAEAFRVATTGLDPTDPRYVQAQKTQTGADGEAQRQKDQADAGYDKTSGRAIIDAHAQAERAALDSLHQTLRISDAAFIDARAVQDRTAADLALQRVKDDNGNIELAEAVHTAALQAIDDKAAADKAALDGGTLDSKLRTLVSKAEETQKLFAKGFIGRPEMANQMRDYAKSLEELATNLEALGTPEAKEGAEQIRKLLLPAIKAEGGKAPAGNLADQAKTIENLRQLAAAERQAGNPEVAKSYDEQAEKLEKVGGAALKAYMKLNKFSEWAGVAGQVSGAFSTLAGAMGETEQEYDRLTGAKLNTPWKDLSANLQGAGKAFNTLQTLAGDAMAVIANPADIKAWGKLVVDVISSIADALSGFKKAAVAVQKNKDDFKDQNPYLNASDYQKTFTRSRGFFADAFGGGPEVVNQIDKMGLKIAQTFIPNVYSGIDGGFKKYLESGNMDDFAKTFSSSIAGGIQQALADSFKNEPDRVSTWARDTKRFTDTFKPGGEGDRQASIDQLIFDTNETTKAAKEYAIAMDEVAKATQTGRYSPEAIAAQQRKVQSAGLNNIQTSLAIQNRAKLISDAEYQDKKHRATLAQLDIDQQDALAAEGLTDQDRLNINDEFNLKRQSADQDYLDWTVEAARKAAERTRQIKLQALTNADDLASAQRGLSLAGVITDDEHPEAAAEARRRIDEAYESDHLRRTLARLELEHEAAQSAADLTDEDRRSNDEQYDAQRRVAELNYSTFLSGQAQARADEAKKALMDIKNTQDGFLNTWGSVAGDALTAGLEAASFDTFFANFSTNMQQAVLKGVLAGVASDMIRERLRPFSESLRLAQLTPGYTDDLAVYNSLPAILQSIPADFKPLFNAFQASFTDLNNSTQALNSTNKDLNKTMQEKEVSTYVLQAENYVPRTSSRTNWPLRT